MKKLFHKSSVVLLAVVMACSVVLTACQNFQNDLGEFQNIYIVKDGLKTEYTVGEAFDYDAVTLNAIYTEGSKKLTLNSAGVEYNTLDMSEAGTETLTVTYKGASDSVDIHIVEENEELVSVRINRSMRTEYNIGDEFDYDSVKLIARYSTGREVELTLASEGVTYNTLDMSAKGEQTLTVHYGDFSDSITITVTDEEIVEKLANITLVTEGLSLVYTVGDEVNYGAFSIKAVYNTGREEMLTLTSEGVTHTEIDTTVAGTQTFEVTYKGLKDSVQITVELPTDLLVSLFELPQAYTNYRNLYENPAEVDRNARNTFLQAAGTYQVGDDNGFVFVPDVRALDRSNNQIITVNPVETTFKLYEKKGDAYAEVAETSTYLMTEEEIQAVRGADYVLPANYYFFKEAAVGKTFKLEISLADSYKLMASDMNTTVEAEILVVDGYNVYNQIGLSVFDNLNINHWKSIKEAAGTLAWDLKPLVKYNNVRKDGVVAPVKQIVLHNNVNINPDLLPENYFWDETRNVIGADGKNYGNQGYDTVYSLLNRGVTQELGYHNMLNGSLRDWSPNAIRGDSQNLSDPDNGEWTEDYHSERVNMQKAIYNSTGTGITGNCMTISYTLEGNVHKLYTVYDGKSTESAGASPLSHWSFFKYMDETCLENDGVYELISTEPMISNLNILGKMPRLADTNGIPAQLMAFNTATDLLTLENCIISQVYVAVTGEQMFNVGSNITVSNTKIFDVYSNMFYAWRAIINVKNSVLKEAGGPVFILCDGNRTGSADDEHGPHLYVDRESDVESYAAGYEPWYELNNARALFTVVKGQLAQLAYGYLGMNFINGDMTSESSLVNVVAVLICEPGDLMSDCSSNPYYVSGTIQRGEGETAEGFAMNPVLDDPMLSMALTGILATQAPVFYSGPLMAAYVAGALAGMGDVVGTTAAGFSDDVLAIRATWAAAASDWLFITMRATTVSPRFGLLLGNVAKV